MANNPVLPYDCDKHYNYHHYKPDVPLVDTVCNLRDDFVRYCAIVHPFVEGLEHSCEQEAEKDRVKEHNRVCQYAPAVKKFHK